MTVKPRDSTGPSSRPAPATTGRIIGLDGARGLSAVGVAVMHVAGNFSPNTAAQTKIGIVGMSLIFFFVLSGFLLFLPYVRRLTEDASVATAPSARNFAVHRIARIVPGYLAIFLLCNYVFGVVYVENPTVQTLGTDEGTGTITDPWQLLANLTLVHTYIPDYIFTGLNPSWSLTLEFAFYASLPLAAVLLFAMRRRTSVRPLLLAASLPVLFIVIGFVGKLLLPLVSHHFGVTDPELMQWGPNWVSVYLRSFLVNADNFAFGMLAAVAVVAIEQGAVSTAAARKVRPVSALALPVVLAVGLALIALGNMFGTSAMAIASALAILVIVAPLSCGQRSRIGEGLELAPFLFVGKVSLSLYLLHFPTMLMLHRFGLLAGDSLGGMCLNIVVVLAVSLAVSSVTYYTVEKPAMNFARRYRYRWR